MMTKWTVRLVCLVGVSVLGLVACKGGGSDPRAVADQFLQTAQKGDAAKIAELMTAEAKEDAAEIAEDFKLVSDCQFASQKEEKESEGTWTCIKYNCKIKRGEEIQQDDVGICMIKEGDKLLVGDVD